MRPPPDPELVFETLALVQSGVSLRDAAQIAKVSEGTIRKWIKSAKSNPPPPPPAVPAHMAPPPPAAPAVEVGDDQVAGLRAMMNRALARSAAAEAAGNYTAAQRDSRDAAGMAVILARLTRSEAEDANVIRISRAQVQSIEESLTERIAAIVARPLLCAACACKLSVSWGTGGLPHVDPNSSAKAR